MIGYQWHHEATESHSSNSTLWQFLQCFSNNVGFEWTAKYCIFTHLHLCISVCKCISCIQLRRIIKCSKRILDCSCYSTLHQERKKRWKKKKANKKSLSCYFLLWVIAFSIPPPSEALTVSSAFHCFYWFVALQGESQTLAKPKGVLTSFFKNKSTSVLNQCKESTGLLNWICNCCSELQPCKEPSCTAEFTSIYFLDALLMAG